MSGIMRGGASGMGEVPVNFFPSNAENEWIFGGGRQAVKKTFRSLLTALGALIEYESRLNVLVITSANRSGKVIFDNSVVIASILPEFGICETGF
jgi:hypothetical protein